MSVAATSWIWSISKEKDLKPGELVVALAIADHCNPQGYGFPSLPTIAIMANVSESTARRSAQALISKGVMERQERWRTDGGKTSNAYQLCMTPPVNLTGAPPSDLQGGEVSTVTGAPCHSSDRAPPVTGDRGILDPSIRSTIEPAQTRAFSLDEAKDALRAELAPAEWLAYVQALEAIQTDDEIRILAPNDFVIGWLVRNGKDERIRTLIAESGEARPVEIVKGSTSAPVFTGEKPRTVATA